LLRSEYGYACGIAQNELAERLGCTQSFVAKIEADERLDVVEFVAWVRALKAAPGAMLRRFVNW